MHHEAPAVRACRKHAAKPRTRAEILVRPEDAVRLVAREDVPAMDVFSWHFITPVLRCGALQSIHQILHRPYSSGISSTPLACLPAYIFRRILTNSIYSVFFQCLFFHGISSHRAKPRIPGNLGTFCKDTPSISCSFPIFDAPLL